MDYYDVAAVAFIMTENVALPQISPCKVLITKPFIHYLWVRGGRHAGTAASSSQDASAEINNHTKCKQFGDKLHQPASLLIHPDGRFKINASSPKRLSQHFIVSHFSTGQFLISLPQSAEKVSHSTTPNTPTHAAALRPLLPFSLTCCQSLFNWKYGSAMIGMQCN